MPSESEDRPAVTRDGENLWPATQPPNTVSEQSVPATTPPLPGGDGIVGPRLPDYEVLGELGRGGMGVVYKARQIALKRLVALKMILAGSHAGPEHLERFQREAEAVARLQHPNIVQVHETGQWRSEGSDALLPYFSLEFVEGGSLDRYLAGTPQLPEESAQLLQALARAIHAAHQAGIVHRDLKPANILLANLTLGGEQPRLSTLTPKITDFGLAKQLDADVGQTQSGAIMGTPAYMAPEQASGRIRAIGPATDVWALGAILYECLTGRTPFKAANLASTLAQILTQEPVPPTRLAPKTPRDLETICLKCLEKEPRKRYPSAQALAEDLGRFLEGKPIHARPVGALERLRKWSRRQPAVATLAATVLVVFLTGFGLVLWQLWEAQAARDRADQNAKDYRDASEEATKHARTAETETAKALRALKDRDQALGVRDVSLYVSNMNLVQRHWERGDVPAVLALLAKHVPAPGQPDLRGFEWHYYWHLCHAALKVATDLPGPVKAVACAPDGARLAIGCLDGSVLMWETSSSKKPTLLVKAGQAIRAVAFSPDGQTLAAVSGGQVVLYRAPRDAGGKKPLPQMSTIDWHRLQSDYADADWHQLQAEARGSVHHPFALAFHRDRLVEARPLDPAVWLQRARGHFVAGNVESALRDCDRSLKLNSSDGEAWLLRAQCHIERGSWDEAAADLQQAVKLTAGAKQHLLHALAGVQLRRKDAEGYREVCRELLVLGRAALKRSAADREEFLQAVWISSLSPVDGMDREQLIQEIKPLLTALPEDYLAMMAYALALVRSDKFADAAALLAKANKLHPDAPSVWLLLALALGRQGQRDEARQWLARAVTWHDQVKKGGPAPRGQLSWQQLLWIQREAFELLRREAENLLAR